MRSAVAALLGSAASLAAVACIDTGALRSDDDGGARSPASYPSTPVLDDFNRGDGPLGGNWSSDDHFGIAGGHMKFFQSADGCGGGVAYFGGKFGSTEEVFATFAATPGYGQIELRAKVSPTRDRWVALRYTFGTNLAEVVSTAPEGVYGDPIDVKLSAGTRLGARFMPDGRVIVFKDGAVVGERTTTGWNANGGGSLAVWANCAGNDNGFELDDFGGGDVPGTAPSP